MSAKSQLETILAGAGIPVVLLDGSDQANHPRLRKLFEISGQRGKYPQVFREEVGTPLTFERDEEGAVESAVFVGMADDVIDMNDSGNLMEQFQ